MNETSRHAVWLHDQRIGWLYCHDNYTWFEFTDEYLADAERPVLGLRFEERPRARFAANLRLPQWFSNLLPEGVMREWIAAERDVAPEREMELLARVGHDLPGAVRVLPAEFHTVPDVAAVLETAAVSPDPLVREHQPWKFSLAGVGLKFSMLRDGKRFTCTATGEGGDWILKLPDTRFSDVPRNEYAMMRFADAIGIDVPKVALVHRDEIDGVPAGVWPSGEEYAYAVERFDRDTNRRLVHIEDFAQVRAVYPVNKYEGNFETVASLAYRGRDTAALHEFVRRLVFFVLIGNGDAHLKNWSLIYRDKRVPTLSPAYDIMSTEAYGVGDGPEDLGLKFAGNKRFDSVRVYHFDRLARKLRCPENLSATAMETIDRVRDHWPSVAAELEEVAPVRDCVEASIAGRTISLTRSR
ncbi:type II toxin-antitoxin system HipA family toxin [Nocardia niwae]|uniref:HipA domain-containing protein n=1 Tax=Nocardia niwae TaxID=626084 RepID=A0ABV2XHK5_9NOCA|nr:HipA domain-containing protein [Nocardia niwae]